MEFFLQIFTTVKIKYYQYPVIKHFLQTYDKTIYSGKFKINQKYP